MQSMGAINGRTAAHRKEIIAMIRAKDLNGSKHSGLRRV
jgi:hypothetical protein